MPSKKELNCSSSDDALKKVNTALEAKVRERTKELQSLADTLDIQVKEKTQALEEKIEELEKFNKLAIGRELKMIDLKEENKELKKELKKYIDN
jgi:C4-dicarboxylate-specific signal transduction histidine kinase